IRSNTFASRCTGRRWASRLRLTRPASSSTFRCLETAWTVTSYGAASSLTVASPTASLATMSRRVGSASAENTRESGSAATPFLLNSSTIWLTITVRRSPHDVNRLVDEVPSRARAGARGGWDEPVEAEEVVLDVEDLDPVEAGLGGVA